MIEASNIDSRNTYNPNLSDIGESAMRTYGEANSFFRKEELYLKDIIRRLSTGELKSQEDIYDKCHAVASDLAKCSEMYLKSLYLYEHKFGTQTIDELWEILKRPEYKTDSNGKLLYITQSKTITYPLYDINGNVILDSNGVEVYTDDNGNLYTPSNRGSKIKVNGHDLDRLIKLLSNESRILLETRMLCIPTSKTDTKGNKVVSIIDLLRKKSIISTNVEMSRNEYSDFIDRHKKVFEESRYSGEKATDVNIEFLYHLATQIKAVAQYIINPSDKQIFSITDEELKKLPAEIQKLVEFDKKIVSEELIRLIVNNENAKAKLLFLINNNYLKFLEGIKSNSFYNMINDLQLDEIIYLVNLCSIKYNYNSYIDRNNADIIFAFSLRFLSINHIINICLEIKSKLNINIGSEIFIRIFNELITEGINSKHISNQYINDCKALKLNYKIINNKQE